MEQQFYTILTKVGKAKIANSNVLNTKLNLTKFQVGDGGGVYYNPTEDQTKLKNKVWEGNINSIRVDKDNPSWIVIEVVIPSNEGGFMIREAGILDDEGNLIAVGKYPETFKPHIDNGSSKDLFIRMILEISNTQNVTLKVDPTIIMATKKDIEVLESRLKGLDERVGDIENSFKDNTLISFKTDVLSTKLDGCAGGFVNVEKVQGQTLVNLLGNVGWSKVNDNTWWSYNTNELIQSLKPNTVYTQIVLNSTSDYGIYAGQNVEGGFVALGYENKSVYAFTTPSTLTNPKIWQPHILSLSKKDISLNIHDVKVMLLEGDWTNKPIPGYFEGIKSVGEPVEIERSYLTPTSLINVTNKQIVDVTFNSIYFAKVGDSLSWILKDGSVLVQNIKIINIQGNTLTLDLGRTFSTESYIATNEKFELKKYGYRIEILSRNENICPEVRSLNDVVYSRLNILQLSTNNGLTTATGKVVDWSFGYSKKINLKPNTNYTFFVDGYKDSGASGGIGIVKGISDSPTPIETNSFFNLSSTREIKKSSFNTGNFQEGYLVIYPTTSTSTQSNMYIYNVWLLEGIQDKPFIQNKQDKTEILTNQPLRQWDSIDSNGQIIRWSGQRVLNGTESWIYDAVQNHFFWTDFNVFSKNHTVIICDKLKFDNTNLGSDMINVYSGGINIRLSDSKTGILPTDSVEVKLQKFKNYLTNNNLNIVYQTAYMATEDINKSLDLRAYDNLIVNSGAIQPTINYSYAKNIGERLVSIENTVEGVKDKVENSIKTYELTLLNGYTTLNSDVKPMVGINKNIGIFNMAISTSTLIPANTLLCICPVRPKTNCGFKMFESNNGTKNFEVVLYTDGKMMAYVDIPIGKYVLNGNFVCEV